MKPTGDAPTTSELSTILLPTKVRLILEVLRYCYLFHFLATLVYNNWKVPPYIACIIGGKWYVSCILWRIVSIVYTYSEIIYVL